MADVTPAKNNLQTEEVDFKSALSEQLFTKIAGSVNFINDKQMCVYDFKFLGGFSALSGGEDGAMVAPFDLEICALTWRLRDCGSASATNVDLHKIDSSGVDQGSLFGLFSHLTIAHNETDQKGFYRNFIDGTSNSMSHNTAPTMTDENRLISAGESLRIDLISAATDAKDLVVTLFYRPR